MTEKRQDLVVGVFALIGLSALGAMVVLLGEAPQWLKGDRYTIRILFPRRAGDADRGIANLSDVRDGTVINLRGIEIGRVTSLKFVSADRPEQGTLVFADIQKEFGIPRGSIAVVRPAAIGFGRSNINIEVPAEVTDLFPKDGSAELAGTVGGPLDSIIPQRIIDTLETTAARIGELAKGLTPVAGDLHEILKVRPVDEVEAAAARGESASGNLYSAVDRLYRVLTHFDKVLGDPETQSNVKVAVANFREMSEEAKIAARDIRAFAERGQAMGDRLEQTLDTAREQMGTLGGKLARNSDELSKVLEYLGAAAHDMADGEGTVGKLLRDPKLYDELVITVRRLRETIGDLQKLIDKLHAQGLFSKG